MALKALLLKPANSKRTKWIWCALSTKATAPIGKKRMHETQVKEIKGANSEGACTFQSGTSPWGGTVIIYALSTAKSESKSKVRKWRTFSSRKRPIQFAPASQPVSSLPRAGKLNLRNWCKEKLLLQLKRFKPIGLENQWTWRLKSEVQNQFKLKQAVPSTSEFIHIRYFEAITQLHSI